MMNPAGRAYQDERVRVKVDVPKDIAGAEPVAEWAKQSLRRIFVTPERVKRIQGHVRTRRNEHEE